MHGPLLALLLTLVAAFQDGAAPPAPTQDAPGPDAVIRAVVIEGATKVPESTLLSRLQAKEGTRFSWDVVERDRKDLFERFRIVAETLVETLPDGGVRLTWKLDQPESIRRVVYEGNEELSDEDLDEVLDLTGAGATRSWYTSEGQVLWLMESLHRRYEEEGFLYAEIRPRFEREDGDLVLHVDIQEGPKVRVDEISFLGNEAFDEGDLESIMDTDESWLFIRNTFKREKLEADLGKLEDFYAKEGYLDARVALEELRPHDDYREVDVVIRVEEGPRYTIGELRFAGNAAFSEAELRALLKLRPGRPLRQMEWERDVAALRRFYGHRGYVQMDVDTRNLLSYRMDEPVVDLTFHITEDRPKRIRDVLIHGNVNTSDVTIRREFWQYPGDLIDLEELQYTEDRLRASRLFLRPDGISAAWVEHTPTDDPDREDIDIRVEEGDTGFMNFIAGFGSGSGGFFGVSIDKENFDIADLPSGPLAFFPEFFDQKAFHGAGQRLQLRANPGARFSNYVISFEEPNLTGPTLMPVSLDLDLSLRESLLRLYQEDRYGASFVVSKWVTRDASLGIGMRTERVEISDVLQNVPDLVAAEGKHSVRALVTTAFWRDFDSLRNPTRGFSLNLRNEVLGKSLGGDIEAFKSLLQGQLLVPLWENEDEERHVLEFNTAVAFAQEYGSTDDLPFFERYRAGGLSALKMRGFDFWGVGPHQSGEPVGGKGGVVWNTDYVFPLYSTFEPRLHEHIPVLKGVVFVDQGMLESDWEDLPDGLWRISAGIGLKLRIPVQILAAPLEFYYGVPIQKTNDDERESFSLSFSTRF